MDNDENEGGDVNQNNLSIILNNNKENNQQLTNGNITPTKIGKNKSENTIQNVLLTLSPKNENKSVAKFKRPKKPLKKDKYIKNVVQNYIVKYNFKKLIQLSLQINDVDFNENDKNEKFLKLMREKFGIENYLCILIDSLQKTYFDIKKPKKKPYKPYNNVNSLNNSTISINNNANMNVNINPNINGNIDPNITANINASIDEIISSSVKASKGEHKTYYKSKKNNNNNINIMNPEKDMKELKDSIGRSKMKITYEDLNKEITDILNGTANKMYKKKENNDENSGNTGMININNLNDNNDNNFNNNIYISIYKNENKNDNKNDINSIMGNNDTISINDTSDIQSIYSPLNNSLNKSTYSMNMNNLGLSVHLHKDEYKKIFKYYLHHYMKEGVAAYYCSDKRCNSSAKYYIDTKKFEIISEHSIPFEKHSYICKPFPNDQRLFKEFDRRNFSEAQLIKQSNGRSNIFWYNNP